MATDMTQQEFNEMLQTAISQGLFGYYTSAYSNEEMDRAVGMALGRLPGGLVGKNLLINPAFQIDQRGKGSYATGYGFDCWIGSGSNSTVMKNEAGDIVFTSGANGGYLYQLLEFPVYGVPLTASALVNGELLMVTATITASGGNGVLYTDWGYFQLSLYMSRIRVALYASPNHSFTLPASKGSVVKLEQGLTQTLAYQDDEGNWRLYEIPDYAEELLKCRRYYNRGTTLVFTTPIDGLYKGSVPFPTEMRVAPTVTGTTSTGVFNAVADKNGFIFDVGANIGYLESWEASAEL